MSRTLCCGMVFCGESFAATLRLPDEYFDANGVPLWHKINSRFGGQPAIHWDRPIGAVPSDEPVVSEPTQETPSVREELQKLRDVVATLEKKFPDGVR